MRLTLLLLLLPSLGEPTTKDKKDKKQIFYPGDIMIGGLFPLHEANTAEAGLKKCGAIKADKGVQRLEAMLYAIDRIQADPNILPSIKLGFHILDTCSLDTYALEQTLEFIKITLSTSDNSHKYICTEYTASPPEFTRPRPVVAVIGAASSTVSVMVANMLRLFKIPQISYSSTGSELSEKPRFEYFSRVVPPDNLQAKAMVDVVDRLNWTYVHAIADSGSYGEKGIDNFRKIAAQRGICFDGEVYKIQRNWGSEEYQNMLIKMKANTAKGVVMFVNEDNVKKILRNLDALIKEDPFSGFEGRFLWVASDEWGTKSSPIEGFEQHAVGAITISPNQKMFGGFDSYFMSLSRKKNTRNVWFNEYWNQTFPKCIELPLETTTEECLQRFDYNYKQESYVPFVIDSVNVLTWALDDYLRSAKDCINRSFNSCDLVVNTRFEGKVLQNLYRNVSFGGKEPIIDAKGDGIGHYNIFQFTHEKIYQKVGEWTDGLLVKLDKENISIGLQLNETDELPLSVCSSDCKINEIRVYSSGSMGSNCCWSCIDCNSDPENPIKIIPNLTTCQMCSLGFIPNARLDQCVPLEPETLSWLSAWAIAPACLSAFGMLCTAIVIYAFIAYNKTPIIMASGRELCYCMLAGIFGCFAMTFVLINPPSNATCAAVRIGLGVFMCAIYAAILTKTSRLARVFTNDIRSVQRPKFITPKAQVAICGLIVSVQLFGAIIWLIVSPPDTKVIYPHRRQAVLSCNATATELLKSLGYNIILILLCTMYAFKTRKIPENFNETKYIGFTMYATCIIWLAFVPIYFATTENFRIQITSLCVCIALSGTVALWCFFAPKVYIVFFQPEKNVRKSHSTAMRSLAQQHMRFISHLAVHQPLSMAQSVDSRTQVNTENQPTGTTSHPSHHMDNTTVSTRPISNTWSSATPKSSVMEVVDNATSKTAAISVRSATTDEIASIRELGDMSECTPFLVPEETSSKSMSPLLPRDSSPEKPVADGRVVTPVTGRKLSKETWVVSDARAEVEMILSEIATQSGTFV